MQSIFNKIIIMYQIVCQSGSQRCLYINELDVNKLRENIRSDFQDIFDNFDLMYIDEQHGDWMII